MLKPCFANYYSTATCSECEKREEPKKKKESAKKATMHKHEAALRPFFFHGVYRHRVGPPASSLGRRRAQPPATASFRELRFRPLEVNTAYFHTGHNNAA
jgi:hypothetical protein